MPQVDNSLEKVTLNIRKGDKEVLQKFYPTVGWSVAARTIISNAVQKLLAAEKERSSTDHLGV